MKFSFDRAKHVFYSPEFEELIKDTIRFFNGTPIQPVPPMESFEGAGVYSLYYIGKCGVYKNFHEINRLEYSQPIYVGKAVPRGWRQGRVCESSSLELYRRLCDHAKSINSAENIEVGDFLCRFMILENAASNLIGTVEAALIRHYQPLWNCIVDGFGNHDPGSGRYNQEKSEWDLLHPGRGWADKCAPSSKSKVEIENSIKQYFSTYNND
ncbi:MAG: Eco29kI family restriction endonuclease [Muribaculaceae bacterium]|nr:Eco29kI family restriction endonuclease [Muribaculaceae bacterium]